MNDAQPVLILGGGINGAAVARELAVNGVPVCLVEQADLAGGATAYSSRLIHGGLRYLEYGEFSLVRESLQERTRLLRLAPEYVRPLELFVPSTNRMGGLVPSALRATRMERWARAPRHGRGAWLVRLGLGFYDIYAQDRTLPRHRGLRTASGRGLPFDARKFPWQSAYFDAQIRYPERFVVALLSDAVCAALERDTTCDIYTYCEARLLNSTVEIVRGPLSREPGAIVRTLKPSAIINATGAWIDRTLQQLHVPSQTLIGGTKGSHILTAHSRLREELASRGIYAEAADGRPIFVLPFGRTTLVGTTDEVFLDDPAEAVATEPEIEYLLDAVNNLLPRIELKRTDVEMHYCGVRPLPHVTARQTAAITRRHRIHEATGTAVPLWSLIGGKLTTCRSLAEEVADVVLPRIGRERTADTRERPTPANVSPDGSANGSSDAVGTDWSREQVRAVIEQQWVTRLDDLVERRLMLVFEPQLSRSTLEALAGMLVESGRLDGRDAQAEVDSVVTKLARRYGKTVIGPPDTAPRPSP